MSQINFLPESFKRSHRRQQRRPAEFALITGTLVALAGLWLLTGGPDHALAQENEKLDRRLDEIAQLHTTKRRLVSERSTLQRKLMVARETYQPISATQLLSRLSMLTPEAVRLINVEMSAQRPEPQAKQQAHGNTKRVGNAAPGAAPDSSLMKITITGHSPSDEQLVTLIRELTADPVFTSVALRSSKQDKTRTHYVRTFHLDVAVDLNRRFTDPPERDASDAD